jgi:hypothetical protein
MSGVDAARRPTLISGAVSVIVGALAVGLVVPTATWPALAAEVGGLAVLALGATLFRRGYRLLGGAAAALGGIGAVGAAGIAVTTAGPLAAVIVTLPGAVGVLALAAAVIPLRGSGSRWLGKLGAGAAFVAVLAAGLFQLVTLRTLLAAGVGTVVAWDAGERAINVGDQLGRLASTRRLEAVRAGGSLLVGAVAVGLGTVAAGVGSPGLPLSALAGLLVAVLLLTAALHG